MKAIYTLVMVLALAVPAAARFQAPARSADDASSPAAPELPADYLIGPEDELSVFVWREEELTRDVIVRPDGMVSLPLINDVRAAGLTPEQFRQSVAQAAARYVDDPTVTVIVKAVNSRKVYITGEVEKPGTYMLLGPTNVVQLLTLAGGLREYADEKNISIMRNEGGKVRIIKFNYREVARGRRLEQNIQLKPGDTVIVP